MEKENIGGISLDDIMAAAMEGLEEEKQDEPVKTAPVVDIPADIPVKTEPVMDIPTDIPVKTEPVVDIPADIPVKTEPVMDIPADIPVKTAPAMDAPANIPLKTEPINIVSGVSSSGMSAPQKDDVYTIGSVRLVNVKNRLAGVYENMIGEIMNYIDAERTAEAMKLAQELVDNNMSSEVAWLIYAYAKEAWGDDALAEKAYKQSIAINPVFAMGLNDIANFYLKAKDLDKAAFYFNKALECDPENTSYMGNVAYIMCFTHSYNEAIEKCEHFIDISAEKTYLQNVLGKILVELSKEYVVDIPYDFEDENSETTPGFISLEDIQAVREKCNKAKSLLTLEEFKDETELAELLLETCDRDCELLPTHGKFQIVLISIVGLFVYTICTFGLGIPFALAALVINHKADKFPRYVFNYVWCTGSDDPLKYSQDSFYKNHDLLKSMADGARDSAATMASDDESLVWTLIKSIFKGQFWFFKARIQFYKRYFKQRKEQKNSVVGTIKTDDM